jgi:Cu-processing system ATP-binding protein
MIEITQLAKRFGRLDVLRGVNVHLARGRITGIVGPNGAGKTTLIKMLLDLAHPTSGEIRIDGRLISGDESYRARIGYMPQMGRFPENLTANELFTMMRDLRGEDVPVDDDLVRSLGLAEHADKPLRTLSGGTRQKVNACLALLLRPELLILDEPTAGLDPRSSALLKDKLLSLKQAGVTVIIASHVMSELEELCDDVVFLLDGVVHYTGPVDELRVATRQINLERAVASLMIREVA